MHMTNGVGAHGVAAAENSVAARVLETDRGGRQSRGVLTISTGQI